MIRSVLLGLVAAATVAAPAVAAPPPYEPIAVHRVPVPAGLSGVSEPVWLPNGTHVVASILSPDAPRAELAVSTAAGRDVHCLTCDLDTTAVTGADAATASGFGKPIAFGDGRRVLARLGLRHGTAGSETQNFTYAVLTCAPSVVRCTTRTLLPVRMPGGGVAQGVQNREARLSPDGRWLAWTELGADGARMSMGRLARGAHAYTLADVRVLTPTPPLTTSANWRAASPSFEIKNFTADGQSLLYSSMVDAENFDTFRLDLRTGARTRLTYGVEWEEDVSSSPDGGSLLQYSSRGFDRMAAFALVPRPPFADLVLFSWTGRFMLNLQNRRCLLEPWLLGRGGEQGTYFGQPVNPAPPAGWDTRTLGQWSPDGTRLLMWESRASEGWTAARPGARMLVADLPARRPARAPTRATPAPTWAPTRAAFRGFLAQTGTYEVPGARGGSATVTLTGTTFAGSWTVAYHHYSDDGTTFLDGTERVTEPSILQSVHWEAALRLSGAHTGAFDADVTIRAGDPTSGNAGSGTVRTTLDGRTVTGLPPATCTPLPVPRLRATATARGVRVRVTVRATVAEDPVARPVRGATVRLGGRTARTDAHGVATVAGRRGAHVQARAAGFRAAGAVAR
jgi:hypothetical protein